MQDLLDRLYKIVGANAETAAPSTHLEDVQWDSLAKVEAISAIHKATGVTVNYMALHNAKSLQDVLDLAK